MSDDEEAHSASYPPSKDANETLSTALKRIIEWHRPAAPACTRRVGLILDDCMTEKCTEDEDGKKTKTVIKSESIEEVFKLGRHWKLFFVVCMGWVGA
jgi:hypothetical protein